MLKGLPRSPGTESRRRGGWSRGASCLMILSIFDFPSLIFNVFVVMELVFVEYFMGVAFSYSWPLLCLSLVGVSAFGLNSVVISLWQSCLVPFLFFSYH